MGLKVCRLPDDHHQAQPAGRRYWKMPGGQRYEHKEANDRRSGSVRVERPVGVAIQEQIGLVRRC